MINNGNNISSSQKRQPIVCVGFPRWEGTSYLSSTVQLMSELSQSHPVLYVDYPFTFKDVWTAKKYKNTGIPFDELTGKAPVLQERILKNGHKIHLLRLPPFLPANFLKSATIYDQITAWNGRKAQKTILKALDSLGWKAPIVINTFNPALGNVLAGKLGESQLVYYCYDEIGAAPWVGRHGARHEPIFLGKVDQTIVSSAGLYVSKKELTKSCNIVKNGVDLSVFSANGERPSDLPKGTIIGYIGSVDDRLDYDLLEAIAQTYTYAHLVLLGRIMDEAAAENLNKLNNVHILGARPIGQLGNYLQAFDVGLIPFVKNELTAGIYPLKINEYLALGLPVVSTHFADLSDFVGVCAIANDHAQFIQKINFALQDKNPITVSERKVFASQNTWTSRAAEFAELIDKKTEVIQKKTDLQTTIIT